MNTNFWQHIHGGVTHFPIVLLLASVAFDFVAWRLHNEGLKRGLHAAGFGSAIVGLLGGVAAVIVGLIMTRGRLLGGGYENMHRLFVWPAFGLSVVAVGWRLLRRELIPKHSLRTYLTGMSVVAALMLGAGYSGGEMLLRGESEEVPAPSDSKNLDAISNQPASISMGQQLFLKNCAHCHGADARGEEGPDLHNLDWTDEQIAARIRNGKKGQMTAFAGKLTAEQIKEVIVYLRSLK